MDHGWRFEEELGPNVGRPTLLMATTQSQQQQQQQTLSQEENCCTCCSASTIRRCPTRALPYELER